MSASNDSADFIDQARWLLEWHNRRSEAFTTRAVAVIGFDGVMMGLLLQGAGLDDVEATRWTWAWLMCTVVAMLAAGVFAILTISAKPTAVPSVQQLRHWWGRHAAAPVPGTTGPQIAESLLNSSKITEVSAVSAAKADADRRAGLFTAAVWAMLAAVVLLAALLIDVLLIAWGR